MSIVELEVPKPAPYQNIPIPRLEEALEALISTRRKIEQGWGKGKMRKRVISGGGVRWNYCVLGAFQGEPARIGRMIAAREFARTIGIDVTGIPHWNDRVATSKQQVLDVFDQTIANLVLRIAARKRYAGLDKALFA